jgi:hypothetical protein
MNGLRDTVEVFKEIGTLGECDLAVRRLFRLGGGK